MNMKKILILFILICFPFIVKAEELCDDSKISIDAITMEDKVGNAEELDTVSIEDKSIKLNVMLHDPGDAIEYVIELKNDTAEDYYLNEDSLKIDSNYIDYEFDYGDSNVVEKESTKRINLKVTYKKRASQDALNNDGSLDDIGKATISMSTIDPEEEPNLNPNTGEKIAIGLVITIMASSLGVMIFVKNKKHVRRYVAGAICLSILIPSIAIALCEVNIDVEIDVKIDGKEAHFVNGADLNMRMKTIAGLDTSGQNVFTIDGNRFTMDRTITAIKYSEEEPTDDNKQDVNIVSRDDSPYPIYMWFDNGTLYWWSEDITPSLAEDSRFLFISMVSLQDISGVSTWDASLMENISYAFFYNAVPNLNGLENWNVSNLKTAEAAFSMAPLLTDISALADWDVSSLENAYGMFAESYNLKDLSSLADWDVSNVKDMSYMFAYIDYLESLDGLEKWDVSSVEFMTYMFASNPSLVDIDALADWNVSSVKDMKCLFSWDTSITNLDALAKWDVSSVESLEMTFNYMTALVSMDGVKNWDVRKVKTMRQLFCSDILLEEIDLSNWETPSLESMINMFAIWNQYGAPWDAGRLKKVIISDKFDTSKVTNMAMLFANQKNIEDYSLLALFDTSSVEQMYEMFQGNTGFDDLELIKNWDVSNVKDMSYMFTGIAEQTQEKMDLLNNWDVRNVNKFDYMFSGQHVFPNFTLVSGTWNDEGSFIPEQ